MAARTVRTDKFVAAMCRQSYYHFFLEFWPIIAAEKLVPSWYIRRLCEELQLLSERVFRDEPKEHDLIWNCPPGTSKSSIVSVLWQPWVWTRMPSARFITGSYSERLALDLSRKSRDVVLSDKYRALFPEIELRTDQNTKSYFVNAQGGMRYAVGVGGSVMGMHAHFIAVDDPIDPLESLSDLLIAEANTWMSETLPSRKVNLMLTPTVLIMQRLHQNDPTGSYLESGIPVKHFSVPCDTTWEVKPPELKLNYVDGLLDAERLPEQALTAAFDRLGEAGYAGQYGQSPTPRGGALFKVDKLLYKNPTEVPDKWRRGPVRYWDKACLVGSSSWTVGVKMALDHQERIWILDVVRGQWSSGDREEMILKVAAADGRKVRIGVEQEPGSGGKEQAEEAARRYARKGFRVTIDPVRASKEQRAGGDQGQNRPDTFSVYVNTGSVFLVAALWNRTFVEEMRYFPRSKYKDQIDAASGAFSLLTQARYRIGAL